MGQLEDLKLQTQNLIYELDTDTDNSRSQSFLEEFWSMREKLQEARDFSYGDEKRSYSKLLNLLNRKGEENDIEPY